MTIAQKHQLSIAKKTLKMNPLMAKIMGMSHQQAREIIKKLKK